MSVYVSKIPLTMVKTTDGTSEYVYGGRVVPGNADPDDVARLVEEGFLVETDNPNDVQLDDPVKPAKRTGRSTRSRAAGKPAAAESKADGSEGDGATDAVVDGEGEGKPPKAASKEAWVDFAVAQRPDGVAEETARAEAEGLTKPELIERFGA